MLSVSV
ncbi:hypothetical protein OIU79_020027, partial [Salix purpurea]